MTEQHRIGLIALLLVATIAKSAMCMLPQHHLPPFHAPKIKGTVAIGAFVAAKDEVHWAVD